MCLSLTISTVACFANMHRIPKTIANKIIGSIPTHPFSDKAHPFNKVLFGRSGGNLWAGYEANGLGSDRWAVSRCPTTTGHDTGMPANVLCSLPSHIALGPVRCCKNYHLRTFGTRFVLSVGHRSHAVAGEITKQLFLPCAIRVSRMECLDMQPHGPSRLAKSRCQPAQT